MSDSSTHSPAHYPESFVRGEAVASTEWLAARIGDPDVKVVDTRFIVAVDDEGRFSEVPGKGPFLESHIPGAVFLDLDDLRDPVAPAHLVGAAVFGELMSARGIGNDDEIVVYDTEGGVWSARLWWALRLNGHERVRILDGGFTSWTLEGRPVESGDRVVAPSRFESVLTEGLKVEIADVIGAAKDRAAVVVDALSEPFHAGRTRLYPSLPAGHIPGAINMPAPDNLDPETHRLLDIAALRERWDPVVDGAERIVTYCGGGMYGAFDLFVLHLLGYDAALYDGSWEEWAATDDLPIATDPPGLPDERLPTPTRTQGS